MTVKNSTLIRFCVGVWAALTVVFFGGFAAWDANPGEWPAAWRFVVATAAVSCILGGLPK